ncbi:MAG TPA: single-stranded-DNA-specific exonuclease RecJ [Candidatus Binatia bacterium]|nr:single-stranded-DNA-specific exonuclease RecJ [Candidatus Binatia bacterium]
MTPRRWMLIPRRPEPESELCGALGVSPLLARLLVNRDVVTPDAADAFLNAKLAEHLRSPMLFRDMARASARVLTAVQRGERIGIYGDYDVDGISGSAILLTFLRALGHEPVLHIPHRLRDGYGVTEAGIRKLHELGTRVMITVDCGGVSHRELAVARELGLEAIVCDHHQVSGTPLPACAVLNPIEPDAGFPFAGLCGAGVAFYLALGIRMRLREAGADAVPDLRRYLDLVTLGTIADIVPIVEENRVLVKHGLRELARSARPGLMALKTVSGVTDISTGVVGFRLAPRLNAGGRLADATRSVELLTTVDRARAEQLAQELDQENRARQAIELEILNDAIGQVEAIEEFAERRSIVLASEDWHPGVIGIVASRLVERYYRPTILIAVNLDSGIGRGSGRSIRHFNLHEAVKASAESLEGFGGHRMAIGLSIRAEQVDDFAAAFEDAVRARTHADQFVPELDVDAELRFSDIDAQLMADLDRLEPFGMGNPEPIFCTKAVTVVNRRVVGENHLKLFLRHDGRALSAIGFGMADREVAEGDTIDLVYSPQLEEWNGEIRLQLRLRDLRAGGP